MEASAPQTITGSHSTSCDSIILTSIEVPYVPVAGSIAAIGYGIDRRVIRVLSVGTPRILHREQLTGIDARPPPRTMDPLV